MYVITFNDGESEKYVVSIDEVGFTHVSGDPAAAGPVDDEHVGPIVSGLVTIYGPVRIAVEPLEAYSRA